MSREIATQQTSLSGATLYATLDSGGQRWNGTAFEAVLLADWSTYAVAMTEAAGTGFFAADQPAGIAAGTPLGVTIFKRSGASPAATDPVVGSGSIGKVAATLAAADVAGNLPSAPAAGSISSATFAAGATIPRVTLADTLTANSDKVGYALTVAYDAAKTAAQAGNAMALTSGERTTLAGVILADTTDVLGADIVAIRAKTDNLPAAPASTTNITAGAITTVGTTTNLTNLPAAPTDWISAPSVSAAAVTRVQAGLSTYAGGDTAGTTTLLSRVTGAVALASQIPANFTTATFASAGVFSAGALANAPTGGSAPTAAAIRAEIDANSTQLAALRTGVVVATNNDKAGYALAATGLDSVIVETGYTARGAMKVILKAAGAAITGNTTTTITVGALPVPTSGSTTTIVATMGGTNNVDRTGTAIQLSTT